MWRTIQQSNPIVKRFFFKKKVEKELDNCYWLRHSRDIMRIKQSLKRLRAITCGVDVSPPQGGHFFTPSEAVEICGMIASAEPYPYQSPENLLCINHAAMDIIIGMKA